MIQRSSRVATFVALLAALGTAGCGSSGSGRTAFPEVRFQVSGSTKFAVVSLVTGGVTHPSIMGQEFVVNGIFSFVVEDAPPPYEATFVRTGDAEIAVTLSVVSETAETQVSDRSTASKDTATVAIGSSAAPVGTPTAPKLEVRFNICAPAGDTGSCFTPEDSGLFGVGFTGTVGDAFTTSILPVPCTVNSTASCSQAPTILFLEGARESVNAVFARAPFTGEDLRVELLLNGNVKATTAGPRDVVIREEL
ncbi:MAG: hypothetical protein ACE5I7_01675 [Candidatus Binatia bacterium]